MGLLSTPVTGSTVSGLTLPTYTLTVDSVAPGINGVAYYVSALGGTQVGVRTHTVSSPFSILATRPAQAKTLGAPNPATGKIPNVQSNDYTITVRKGLAVAADQPYYPGYSRHRYSIPAGSETYDAVNCAALISIAGGIPNGNATSIQTLVTTGSMVA